MKHKGLDKSELGRLLQALRKTRSGGKVAGPGRGHKKPTKCPACGKLCLSVGEAKTHCGGSLD